MRYYYDCEFIEDGLTIDLISIGMVAEDGREYYRVCCEADLTKASGWVKENVIPFLYAAKFDVLSVPKRVIAYDLKGFCDPEKYGKPELWAYYADYDHVALCQLFGTMMDLPKGWPMYTRDIKQFCDAIGNPTLPDQGKDKHNALEDARWNKKAYEFLINEQRQLLGDKFSMGWLPNINNK